MTRRKWILITILLLFLAAAAALLIRFYPVWAAAKIVQEELNWQHFTYEIEIKLDERRLTSEQMALLKNLSAITGIQQTDMYQLTVMGSVWEDKIHALVYPKDAAEPCLELYLSDDTDVINESILFHLIRSNLLKDNVLLEYLIPTQEDNVYMTLEQTVQMFGVDLSGLETFDLSFLDREVTKRQCFLALAAMEREKRGSGSRFVLDREQLQFQIEVPKTRESARLAVQFSVQDPAELIEQNREVLSGLGIELAGEQFRILKSVSVHLVSGAGEELVMPEHFISQRTVELISGIRRFIQQLLGK